MMTEILMQETHFDARYIFWIFGWSSGPIFWGMKFSPTNTRCEISQTEFTLFTPKETITIPLTQIIDVDSYAPYAGAGGSGPTNLVLTIADSPAVRSHLTREGKLYIVPQAVFANPVCPSYDEVLAMIEVIEVFQAGQQPTAHPNPYYRALERRGKLERFSAEAFDALTPPQTYTPIIAPWKFVLLFIGTVAGVVILLMIIIVLIFNVFFR